MRFCTGTSGGFFVFWGSFDLKFVKMSPLNIFFLQNRVKSSEWRTTLQVKSSSTLPISLFYFKNVKSYYERPIYIHVKK